MTIARPYGLEQEDDNTSPGYPEVEEEDYSPDETIRDVICLDPMNKKELSGLDIDTIVTDASGVINASKALVPFIQNGGNLFIAESALAEAQEELPTLPKETNRATVMEYLTTSSHVLDIQEQRRVPEINREYGLMEKLLSMTRRNGTYRCIVDQIDEIAGLWSQLIQQHGISRKGSKVAEDFFNGRELKITAGRESAAYDRLEEMYEGLPAAFGEDVGRLLESLKDRLVVERRALEKYTPSATAKRMVTAEIIDAVQTGLTPRQVAGMMKAQYRQPQNESAVDTILCVYAHPIHLSGESVVSLKGGTAVLSSQSDVKDLVLLRRSMYFK